MNDNFGEFGWKCWKDHKPEEGKLIYLYSDDIPDCEVEIVNTDDINFGDHDYWCYVYIPNVPKIEKKEDEDIENIKYFIKKLCKEMEDQKSKLSGLEITLKLIEKIVISQIEKENEHTR